MKDRLLQSVDIVQIIEEFVPLKKRGKNYIGLCPFHKEKTPSFTINPTGQYYHCFGCKQSGDAITFLMNINNMTFAEALKSLAKRSGITIEFEDEDKKGSYDINEIAAKFYEKMLWELQDAEEARDFLIKRDIPNSAAKKFRLGFAPSSWNSLLEYMRKQDIGIEPLENAGLIIRSDTSGNYHDRFRNRLIFPIANNYGQICGFGGRILQESTDEPKYVNTPETAIFTKGKLLYGWSFARDAIKQTGKVIIVEGYTDVIRCHITGFENAVAVLGTGMTDAHARIFRQYNLKVFLVYDGDEAGIKAAERAGQVLLSEEIEVKVAPLPAGEDPDSLLRSGKSNEFEKILDNSTDIVIYLVERAIQKFGLDSVAGKTNIIQSIIPTVMSIGSPIIRSHYILPISKMLKTSEDALTMEINRFRQKSKSKLPKEETDSSEDLNYNSISLSSLCDNEINSAKVGIISILMNVNFKDDAFIKSLSEVSRFENMQQVISAIDKYISKGSNDCLDKILSVLINYIKEKGAINIRELASGLFEDKTTRSLFSCIDMQSPVASNPAKAMRDYLNTLKRAHIQKEMERVKEQIAQSDPNTQFEILFDLQNRYKELDSELISLL